MNSVEFLQYFHPEGPWILTAIPPNRKGIEAKVFGPKTLEEAEKWIQSWNGERNLYFSVNIPKVQPNKIKYERTDFETVPWLHVDVDARAGEDFSSELERIRSLVDEKCPIQPPSCIVFSGGGYQIFWKLQTPIEINGSLEAAEFAARYNKQLEIIFGGDHCFDIARIMRLPGTTNLPDEKKLKRGRVPVVSTVYRADPTVYDLSSFTAAQEIQVQGVDGKVTLSVDTSNVERLADADALDKWNVSERVKVIIVQGHDPDNPKSGDNSRSAWLFDACCQLARAGVPDDVIFSVITDPDFRISDSVLDKKPKEREYALRQIERAKEEVVEPWLRFFNDRFFVIGNIGGACRIIEEVPDPALNRTRFTKQTFSDFRGRWSHKMVAVDEKKVKPAGEWWLKNPQRRQFDFLVFAPGRTIPNAYNLWQGFGCNAIPGTGHETFLGHLKENVCGGNIKWYRYLLGWMARTVQKPGTTGETAVVLRGKPGTGKSFFAKCFGYLFGRHFLQVGDAKHLVGNFNAHLRDCLLLFGDEAFFAGDRRHESALKTLITEENIMIENKGVDAEMAPNYIHLILASNADWVVPTGAAERRFFVLDVADQRRRDTTYFRGIRNELESGGFENLLHFLLNFDLTNFEVRIVPLTPALREQKGFSMGPMEDWWLNRLHDGSLLAGQNRYNPVVPVGALYEDYAVSCRQSNVLFMGNRTRMGYFLRKVCPGVFPRRYRSEDGKRGYMYEFPPQIQILRDYWDEVYEVQEDWSKEEETSDVGTDLPF